MECLKCKKRCTSFFVVDENHPRWGWRKVKRGACNKHADAVYVMCQNLGFPMGPLKQA